MKPTRLVPFLALLFAVAAISITTTSCDAQQPPPRAVAQAPVAPMLERVTMEPVVVDGRPQPKTDLFALEAIDAPETLDFAAIGDKLLADGRPGEAVDAYRKALARDPSATSWTKLAKAYLQGVDRARGVACLLEALRREPARNDVRVQLARAYLHDGNAAAARVVAAEAVDRDGADLAARKALGRAYLGLSMWQEAIAVYEVVVIHEPDDAHARNNLGYAALQVGQNEVALRALEQIPRLKPGVPHMFNNLGVAYERLGRTSDALAAFSRAAELRPSYVKAASNKERLLRTLSLDEQLSAAESLLALREGRGVAPAALVGEPVELARVAAVDVDVDVRLDGGVAGDGGVEVAVRAGDEVVVDTAAPAVVVEVGGGGSFAGAVLAPSTEPSLP